MLSIVIPTQNELKSNYIEAILESLSQYIDVEIIIVDKQSSDGTQELAERFPEVILIKSNAISRAGRLNEGIKIAKHEMILLHHPRSILEIGAIDALKSQSSSLDWGGFTHKFDFDSKLLKFTSWYSNKFRADKRDIFYLDHCIFAKKSLLIEVGFIPDVDIFEDTEISLLLRSIKKGVRLPQISTTSSVRFTSNGILKQCLNNQKLKWKYYFNANHKSMNKEYENGLDLNSTYNETQDKS